MHLTDQSPWRGSASDRYASGIVCPICQATETVPGHLNAHGHSIARCTSCGFMWVDVAAPSYEDYGGYLFSLTSLQSETRSTERHWGRTLRSLVRQYGPGARLLDIGCGAGYFVHYARGLGFEAEGAEPSSYLRAMAQERLGLALHADASELAGGYHVVTAFEVLEHVPCSALPDFMRTVARLLAPGGTFLGTTPNGQSANVRLLKDRDPVIWPPSHVSYFTPSALHRLLSEYRLDPRKIVTYGLQPMRRVKTRPSFVTAPRNAAQRLIGAPLRALLYLGGQAIKSSGSHLGYTSQFVARRSP